MRKIALAIAALLGAMLALDLATAIYVANMLRIG